MELNSLVDDAHSTAKSKGWWDRPRTPLEIHALIHCEVSEASEAVRNGDEANELEELADVLIRIADYCGYRGWDLGKAVETKMAFNTSRPYRHGGKLA